MRNPFLAPEGGRTPPVRAAANYLLVCVVVVLVFWAALTAVDVKFDFGFIGTYHKRILDGFLMTIALSATSLVVSLLLGALVAVGQGVRFLPARYLCDLYVKVIRGTPLMAQIYLFYYIIGTAVGLTSRFWAGVLILSIFEGAYIAEIIRGSLLSLDRTQLESAAAVGFTHAQSLRYVILPQMIARTLPALTGQFASVIKDSSLLSIIAVIEIMQTAKEISSTNYRLFETYFMVGVLYLVLTLPLTFVSRAFERRFNYARAT